MRGWSWRSCLLVFGITRRGLATSGPGIFVLTPTSDTVIRADGSSVTVMWYCHDTTITDVQVSLLDSGKLNSVISASTPCASLSCDWLVSAQLQASSSQHAYSIQFTSIQNGTVVGTSQVFTIAKQYDISIAHPAQGDYWALGSQQVIVWNTSRTSTTVVSETLEIGLYQGDNLMSTIKPVLDNTDSFTWDILPSLAEGVFQVRITDAEKGSAYWSSESFVLYGNTKSISILNPTTGVDSTLSYAPLDTISIQWSTTGNIRAVSISVIQDPATVNLLADQVSPLVVGSSLVNYAGGSVSWEVPGDTIEGMYRIEITESSGVSTQSQVFKVASAVAIGARSVENGSTQSSGRIDPAQVFFIVGGIALFFCLGSCFMFHLHLKRQQKQDLDRLLSGDQMYNVAPKSTRLKQRSYGEATDIRPKFLQLPTRQHRNSRTAALPIHPAAMSDDED